MICTFNNLGNGYKLFPKLNNLLLRSSTPPITKVYFLSVIYFFTFLTIGLSSRSVLLSSLGFQLDSLWPATNTRYWQLYEERPLVLWRWREKNRYHYDSCSIKKCANGCSLAPSLCRHQCSALIAVAASAPLNFTLNRPVLWLLWVGAGRRSQSAD